MSTDDQPVGMQADSLEALGLDFVTSAGVIKDQATKVAQNIVAAADTGYAYIDTQGKNIESGLRRVESWLNEWYQATELTGETIGQNVISMTTVDKENSDKTQQAAG